MPGRLEGKVAIITGGGGGFGKVSITMHESPLSSDDQNALAPLNGRSELKTCTMILANAVTYLFLGDLGEVCFRRC